jgi:hypothetical protein
MSLSPKRALRRVKHLLQPAPPPPYSYQTSKWYPNWSALLHRDRRVWNKALKNAKNGPQILIATGLGGHAPSAILESTLAVALTLRGANVSTLLCDHALAGCHQALVTEFPNVEQFLENGPAKLCQWCFAPAYEVYQSLGLPVLKYSDYLDESKQKQALDIAHTLPREEIPNFRWNGIAIGEHAMAGALRFYARGELEVGEIEEQVLRRYLRGSLQTTFAMEGLFDAHQFVSACFNHGIYVPQGLVGDVARSKNVRVVNWLPGYRKRRFIFTHHETYHHALMTEPIENWETVAWSPELEQITLEYLKSRWYGTRDWIWFHEKPQHELEQIVAELGIDFSKPTIGMLTNVMWDAQLHYRANAFPNMLAWVLETIRYFAQRPDLQLLIRIHPAEIRGTVPSRQPLLAEIQKAFPELPSNVFIIPPESSISTYVAMEQCDSVIIYGTKTGVELTSNGIPVIVAGEAWIRNKGLTLDACSPQEYIQLLDRLPLRWRLDDAQRTRALKYAFHFFFRRMIPLPMFEPQSGFPFYRVNLTSIEQLAPGADRGLDLVCEGILKGREFVYPAERYPEPAED